MSTTSTLTQSKKVLLSTHEAYCLLDVRWHRIKKFYLIIFTSPFLESLTILDGV